MGGKILIVEDDRAIAQSLTRLLSREGYFVAVTGSAEEALAHLATDPAYDLALLDVTLPGRDGLSCCRQLREQGWRQPILLCTGRSGGINKVAGLTAGADDYLTKPFDPAELLARIRALLRRAQEYNAPSGQAQEIVVGSGLTLSLRLHDALVDGQPAHLTDREYELFSLLARNLGTALDKTWLFQEIWGCTPELGIKALAVYVRRLRRKIERDENNPRYVQTVRGFGYKLVPGE